MEQPREQGQGDGDVYQELERRQEIILRQLETLKSRVALLKSGLGLNEVSPQRTSDKSLLQVKQLQAGYFEDIVIGADPSDPPLSLWVLTNMLRESLRVRLTSHVHSSITEFPRELNGLSSTDPISSSSRSHNQLIFTLIWRKGGSSSSTEPELMVNPVLQVAIRGEVNIARYLGHLLMKEPSSAEDATEVDVWLDRNALLMTSNNKSRQTFVKLMNVQLGKSRYLIGEALSLADVVSWTSLLKIKMTDCLPSNVSKWWKDLSSQPPFTQLLRLIASSCC